MASYISYVSDISIQDKGKAGAMLADYFVTITRWYPSVDSDDDSNYDLAHKYSNPSPASIGRLMRCVGQFVTWGNPIVLHNNTLHLNLPLP